MKLDKLAKYMEDMYKSDLLFTTRSLLEDNLVSFCDKMVQKALELEIYTDDFYKATRDLPLSIPNINPVFTYEDDLKKNFYLDMYITHLDEHITIRDI